MTPVNPAHYKRKKGAEQKQSHKMNPALASEIAELYFLNERDPTRIGEALGWGRKIDDWFLIHPMVQGRILGIADDIRERGVYTIEQHLTKLQEIRDECMREGNLKIALASEIQVGKAAGLYEVLSLDDPGERALSVPENLTNDQIKKELAKYEQGRLTVVPTPQTSPDRYSKDYESF